MCIVWEKLEHFIFEQTWPSVTFLINLSSAQCWGPGVYPLSLELLCSRPWTSWLLISSNWQTCCFSCPPACCCCRNVHLWNFGIDWGDIRCRQYLGCYRLVQMYSLSQGCRRWFECLLRDAQVPDMGSRNPGSSWIFHPTEYRKCDVCEEVQSAGASAACVVAESSTGLNRIYCPAKVPPSWHRDGPTVAITAHVVQVLMVFPPQAEATLPGGCRNTVMMHMLYGAHGIYFWSCCSTLSLLFQNINDLKHIMI